jgi:hypothetical protein
MAEFHHSIAIRKKYWLVLLLNDPALTDELMNSLNFQSDTYLIHAMSLLNTPKSQIGFRNESGSMEMNQKGSVKCLIYFIKRHHRKYTPHYRVRLLNVVTGFLLGFDKHPKHRPYTFLALHLDITIENFSLGFDQIKANSFSFHMIMKPAIEGK